MNIQAELNWIRTELDNISDVNLVTAIKNLLAYAKKNNSNVDFWDTLTMEQQAEIEKGIAELNAGKGITHDKVIKEAKSRLK